MKTIQENDLNAVEAFVNHVDKLIGKSLRGIIEKGTFTEPAAGWGKSNHRTFTPGAPIDPIVVKAISQTLLQFSNRKTALETNVNGVGIYGAIQFWHIFTN